MVERESVWVWVGVGVWVGLERRKGRGLHLIDNLNNIM